MSSHPSDRHTSNLGINVGKAALDRHPLFASRLTYQPDDFFWSWASSRDFRAEADALRQWQRAATASTMPAASSAPSGTSGKDSNFQSSLGTSSASSSLRVAGVGAISLAANSAMLASRPVPAGTKSLALIGPSSVHIDLSAVQLPAHRSQGISSGSILKPATSSGTSARSSSFREVLGPAPPYRPPAARAKSTSSTASSREGSCTSLGGYQVAPRQADGCNNFDEDCADWSGNTAGAPLRREGSAESACSRGSSAVGRNSESSDDSGLHILDIAEV